MRCLSDLEAALQAPVMTISDPAIAHLVSEKSASSGSDAAPAGPASILSRASLSHASLHMMPRSRRKWTPSEDARLAEAVEQGEDTDIGASEACLSQA